MGTHTDVEDVVQQTLLKAYLRLEQFRNEARFSTWLKTRHRRARLKIAHSLAPLLQNRAPAPR